MSSKTGAVIDSVTNVCRSEQISETVVSTVAEAKDVDPLELEPLYSVVDPDALNSMFSPSKGSPPTTMELSFSLADCEVTVRGDGEVAVRPPAEGEGTEILASYEE